MLERYKQFNDEEIIPESIKEKLIERLATADVKQVKEDVLHFERIPKELDILLSSFSFRDERRIYLIGMEDRYAQRVFLTNNNL